MPYYFSEEALAKMIGNEFGYREGWSFFEVVAVRFWDRMQTMLRLVAIA